MAKKRKRKKKKTTAQIVGITLLIVLAVFTVCAFIIIFNWKSFLNKAEELLPTSFTYPTEYEEYVVKYSKEYNVDPVLVFAVIRTESSFDPKATSEVGARGLMQLMPDAFDWLKFRMNDKRDINFDSMYNAETNIQYGTYFLSFLMNRYNNSIELTAAAYHGGFSAVDGWLEKGILDKNNVKIENIPKENGLTYEYVKKIKNAYKHYEQILKEKKIINNE